MYGNPYINTYNPQSTIDRINTQIAELEKSRSQLQAQQQQIPQQPVSNLTQNFQLAPTSKDVIRYASSIEEVQKDIVIGDTPYFSKDMSVVWIKDTKGNIRTYELNEIIPKDEKDIQIELLQEQINELKKGMNAHEQYDTNVTESKVKSNTEEFNGSDGATTQTSKSSSISRVSKSKTK